MKIINGVIKAMLEVYNMNKKTNNQLDYLTNSLIKDLRSKSIEYVDLLAYNRAKNYLINKKYYDE